MPVVLNLNNSKGFRISTEKQNRSCERKIVEAVTQSTLLIPHCGVEDLP